MTLDSHLRAAIGQPVASPRDRALRWRAVADLLTRESGPGDAALAAEALDLLESDRDLVAPSVRALVARALADRPLDPRLIDLLADDGPTPRLADRPPPQLPRAAISTMVRKLGAIAESLGPPAPAAAEAAPPPPPRDDFMFESDAEGRIAWVDGLPRALMIGRPLAGRADEALVAGEAAASVARREAIRDVALAMGDCAPDGTWTVSAQPVTDTEDGRFLGYRGAARRAAPVAAAAPPQAPEPTPTPTPTPAPAAPRPTSPAANGDLLRELAHEVKTPLNAIIGFAEVIDGQYLGPAHRPYRQRAAEIVSQARSLLNAVSDLDLAARLQASGELEGHGTEFRILFPKVANAIHERGADRGVEFVYRLEGQFARCALNPALSERIVMRLAESLIDVAAIDEPLSCSVGHEEMKCLISIQRPAALADVPAEALFDPAFDPDGSGRLGIGFSLRLLRGLAGLAKGELRVTPAAIELLIPGKRD